MKRRDFMSGLVATAILAGPALAQDYVASVISQLEKMGFRGIRQERTLLGRVRIIGTRGDGRREIIINPNNGEILRDLWTPAKGDKAASTIIEDKSGGSGSSGDSDDDDNEDDDDGDESGSSNDDEDDNSGSGNGGGDDGDDGDDGDEDDDGDDDEE